jgi:hypothetical protein
MKTILTVLVALLLTACSTPEEQRQYAERERIQQQQEQQRRAALSPSARCREEADGEQKYCDVQCALRQLQGYDGQACKTQCLQQKSMAYQLCTYK